MYQWSQPRFPYSRAGLRVAAATAILPALLMLAACANPADDKPAAVVDEAGAAAPASAAAAGKSFTFTDESTIGFTGSKITGSHEGGFRAFGGEVVLVDGDPTRSRVNVTIDTTSLWADNDRLTGHLKSPDFFDVEKFPTATFNSSRIEKSADGYTITGDLDLHGVRKQISFPAQVSVADGRIEVDAEFVIMRFDFGIEYPGKPDDLIRDEVVVRLDLVAVPAA